MASESILQKFNVMIIISNMSSFDVLLPITRQSKIVVLYVVQPRAQATQFENYIMFLIVNVPSEETIVKLKYSFNNITDNFGKVFARSQD